MLRTNLTALAITAAILLAPAAARAQTCGPLIAGFEAVEHGPDLAAIKAAADLVRSDSESCRPAERELVNHRAALAHVRIAREQARAGAPPERRRDQLASGRRFAQPWQLLAALGDVLSEIKGPDGRPDFAEASLAYQGALAALDNPAAPALRGVAPPTRAEIERIYRLANQTRFAARKFTPGGGVVTRSIRGVGVDSVPVPVQFHYKQPEEGQRYDAAHMTGLGQRYAQETAELLRGMGSPRIRLVGHTDDVAGPDYNQRLGLRRAAALKQYLVAQGYDARAIEVRSRGKSMPLVIENAARYTHEELQQMQRRVEICFLDQPNTSEACK